ncbi:hypothetical protein AAFF_G00235060 [Aldrovandia affinis]|uniref:Uncharacterized protein n=1 Tax=Aldrovandia affinis TaxID=143900 RepID=A0AAD7SW30_9TELE|nr:hypothetical protein AAFF_G00235060 [Aldrovandia affinis]
MNKDGAERGLACARAWFRRLRLPRQTSIALETESGSEGLMCHLRARNELFPPDADSRHAPLAPGRRVNRALLSVEGLGSGRAGRGRSRQRRTRPSATDVRPRAPHLARSPFVGAISTDRDFGTARGPNPLLPPRARAITTSFRSESRGRRE